MTPIFRLVVQLARSVRHFEVPADGSLTIGKASSNDVALDLPGVSRRHARLDRARDGFVLTDLGSKNGLLCDGERVAAVALTAGRRVQLGSAFVSLEEVASSDARVGLGLPLGTASTEPSGATGPGRDEGSAAAALRLVRELDEVGRGTLSQRRDLLDRARAVLGAQALAVASLQRSDGLVIEECWGAVDERVGELLARALAIGEGIPGVLLAPRAAPRTGFAAVLPDPTPALPAWRRDFFAHLARRLELAGRAQPTAAPAATSRSHDLVFPPGMVVGSSPAMSRFVEQLRSVVDSEDDVLLIGETGTGKELVARTIHATGPSRGGPWKAINCAAIPGELLEAELFGVAARVATQVDPRPGLFLEAAGGTVLLDEIIELPERLQAKLLRVIQEREVLPLGSSAAKPVRVRIVAAANRDPAALVAAGALRADLYYRLTGLELRLPPLRERREDIPELVVSFAAAAARKSGKRILGVSARALARLAEHPWPGNVRELEKEVKAAVRRCPSGGQLESRHFTLGRPVGDPGSAAAEPPAGSAATGSPPPPAAAASRSAGLRAQVSDLERRVIVEALAASGGNKSATARRLKVTRNGLAMMLRRLGIE